MVRSAALLTAFALHCAPALAQHAGVPMTDEEIRSEFLGTRMSGVLFETGVRFVECIEPGGRSIYRYGSDYSEGNMSSVSEGVACFTYASGTSCFEMLRHPGGYIVSSVSGRSHFVISKVERDVRSCSSQDLIG